MYKEIDYLELKDKYLFIDVRSPGEYEEYTIPGAINIPLFTDDERKEIGTTYKNISIDDAKRRGIEIVSKKLLSIYDQISELKSKHRNVAIFCERGGMRSSSLCSLLSSLGMGIVKLSGGYKGYRASIVSMLPLVNEETNYIVLHGFTGTGKTDMLEVLEKQGYHVLNLEKLANHRGSLLGKVGLEGQVSQKLFESMVFEKLKEANGAYTFVEAESGRIGNIIVPQYIIKRLRAGKHILVESNINCRAKRIVDEYIKNDECIDELLMDLLKLEKYVGKNKITEYADLINQGNYLQAAVELMEKHYDPLYHKSQTLYEYDLVVNSDNVDAACDKIDDWMKNGIDRH